MNHYLLFEKDHSVVATELPGLPSEISFRGQQFRPVGCLGDFNHLINEKGELVGFEFPYTEIYFPEAEKLFRDAKNVFREDGSITIYLGEANRGLLGDGALILAGMLFGSTSSGEMMLVCPIVNGANEGGRQWPLMWQRQGFDAENSPAPVASFTEK